MLLDVAALQQPIEMLQQLLECLLVGLTEGREAKGRDKVERINSTSTVKPVHVIKAFPLELDHSSERSKRGGEGKGKEKGERREGDWEGHTCPVLTQLVPSCLRISWYHDSWDHPGMSHARGAHGSWNT